MIGEIINERYRLDSVLGHGGMGAVYRGHDLQLERDVAIKLLNQVVFVQHERNRLLEEAKLIARLRHPNIVSVYDVGNFTEAPFFVMEFVDGGSLRDFPEGEFADKTKITLQICRGLTYAHDRGIVHRDLKPENVLLDADARIKLADFGIARADVTRFTSQDQITGTAHYMAPEIIKGEPFDNRADLYSLGVIIYELYTGQLPFDADTLMGLINQHLFQEVTPPRDVIPSIPENLNDLILLLLSKDPQDRPASGRAVIQTLESLTGSSSGEITSRETISLQEPKITHNLISPTSSFIGRQADLDRIHDLLSRADCRLVTLVGTGGIGKTRLASQAAYQSLDLFPDGVWMIELASLTEAGLLPQRVAAIFGVSAQEARQGQGETEVLIDYLLDRNLLLVIDNCEHLIDASARFINQLLNGCPRLKVLATSREDLRIPGENLYQVDPLVLPGEEDPLSDYLATDAIQLFIDRATAARNDFEVTPHNCGAVFQICQRLDGIPLAIELAAARTKMLTPDQIAERLDDRFKLLTAGSRTALPRHQTLEAALDWSYNLLSEEEQHMLRSLSVYSGGFNLDALAAQSERSGVPQVENFDLVAQLADKSLVLVDEQEDCQRFKILETIRQYGIQKLSETGKLDETRRAHLEYYLELAETNDPKLRSDQQLVSLAVLDAEHDNLRSALRWSINQRHSDLALRLVGALGWYWFMRGFWNETSEWLTQCMSLEPDDFPLLKARAIYRAGGLDIIRGKLNGKPKMVEQALGICRDAGDMEGTAWCLNLLGQVGNWGQVEVEAAEEYLLESIEIFTGMDDQWGSAWSTRYLGQIMDMKGGNEQCIQLQIKAKDTFELIGDTWNAAFSLYLLGISYSMYNEYEEARLALKDGYKKCQLVEDKVMAAHALRGLGLISLHQNRLDEAEDQFNVALVALQKIGDLNCASRVLQGQGELYLIQGDYADSAAKLRLSLAGFQELGTEYPICTVLAKFALLADATGDYRSAALLLAFVEKNLGESYLDIPAFKEEHQTLVASVEEHLGSELSHQLWAEGDGLSLESAIQLAMGMEVE